MNLANLGPKRQFRNQIGPKEIYPMKTLTKSRPIVFPNRPLSADFIEDNRENIEEDIIYPESDGQSRADNTKQFRVITTQSV